MKTRIVRKSDIAPLQRFSCSKRPSLKDIEQENLMILSRNKILTSIKGHYSVTNQQKITGNNPNLEIVNINAYTKFCEILSICSPDIEWKRNSDKNQGL